VNQLALEPTAVEEAIETGVATGEPPFWHGYTRAGKYADRKRWPVEKMADELMDEVASIYGSRPDAISCCPENVEALTAIPVVRIYRRPIVKSPDTIYFGSAAWS